MKLKKKHGITIAVLFLFVMIYFAIAHYRSAPSLAFAEQITLVHRFGAYESVVITDPDDVQTIISAIRNGTSPWPWMLDQMIGCYFGIELVFEGRGRKVYVSPATDGCPPIVIGGKLFMIDEANQVMLFEIIQKYTDALLPL